MVGKMVFGERILIGLLMGRGSGWLVLPDSHQLEARLSWEGSSILAGDYLPSFDSPGRQQDHRLGLDCGRPRYSKGSA